MPMLFLGMLLCLALAAFAVAQTSVVWPESTRVLLESTQPLKHPRGGRLPLYLWPARRAVVDDPILQEAMVKELDRRGIAVIGSWRHKDRAESLKEAIRLARVQARLGVQVNVDATGCQYGFFNGDPRTAHIDDQGNSFFDDSFGKAHKMGCPFAVDFRYPVMTDRIKFFVEAYAAEGLPLDFVYGDWEIDGPIEWNRSWSFAKRCVVCRRHIGHIDDFQVYQKTLRLKRADMTRKCYVEPILDRYPKARVGNYGVYPHDGFRYWFDYFESLEPDHPHRLDQRAPVRSWFPEFEHTGYTFAMPVVYTWYPTFHWYDFDKPDYRWFYNMLRVGSNAGRHTGQATPVITFVHWHTTAPPERPDPAVRQMSQWAYQELLWHLLLRGHDGLFLWCPQSEEPEEVRLVHEVYAASLEFSDWLSRGEPVHFKVPASPGPVVSAVRLGNQVLVRRTDFGSSSEPVSITVHGRRVSIRRAPGKCQVLPLQLK